MLLCDIGPVYIRCALVLSSDDENVIDTEMKANLQTFDFNLECKFFEKVVFFFKINLLKLDSFINSKDLEIIKILIDNNTDHYYCGVMKESTEEILLKLFNIKPLKLGHVNQLSVLGLDYISKNIENAFYELPKEPITNLVNVGHSLNEVTVKNHIQHNCIFPLLFANVLEGVSIYKAESAEKIERIGGSTFGASTYWNLVSMACGYDDPEIAVKDAIKGNNTLIDLSVGDIYGGEYSQFSLASNIIASSFGKLKNVENIGDVKKEDISRSLITLFCVTSAQITALLAINSGIDKVIFLGNPFESLEFFQMIQMVTDYYSNDTVKAYFTIYSSYINLIGMLYLLIK